MSLIPLAAWGQMMPASQAALSKVKRVAGTKRGRRKSTKKAATRKKRGAKRGKRTTVNGRKLTAKQLKAGFGGKRRK